MMTRTGVYSAVLSGTQRNNQYTRTPCLLENLTELNPELEKFQVP